MIEFFWRLKYSVLIWWYELGAPVKCGRMREALKKGFQEDIEEYLKYGDSPKDAVIDDMTQSE